MPNFARVLSAAEARARQMVTRDHRQAQSAVLEVPETAQAESETQVAAGYPWYYVGADVASTSFEQQVLREQELVYGGIHRANASVQQTGTSLGFYQNAWATGMQPAFFAPASLMQFEVSNFNTSPTGLQAAVKTVARVVEMPSRTMLKREAVTVDNIDATDARQILARDAEALLGYAGLREEVHAPGRLRAALAKLEIQVLDEKSVDAYKKQMTEHFDTAGKMVMPTWRLKSLREYKQPVPEFVLSKAVEIKRELPEAEFYVDQLAVDPFLIVSLVPLVDFNYNKSRGLDPEMSAYIEVWDEPKFEGSV